MLIGIIGAAAVGQAVAGHAIKAGHQVIISNSRGPQTLGDVIAKLGDGARAGTKEEAAAADIVLLAVPWIKLKEALGDLPDWNGRVLMDATNHFITYAPDYRKDDLGDRTSSEIVAELAPGARIVKAFNSMLATHIAADPTEPAGHRVLFISGDDAEARKRVTELAESFGFAPIELGDLATGGKLQQLGGPLAGPNLLKLS